jgi:hypothetical protein
MKQRHTDEQIIGFLRQAAAAAPIKTCVLSTASSTSSAWSFTVASGPSAQFLHRHSILSLTQEPDHLFFRKPILQVQPLSSEEWTPNRRSAQNRGDVGGIHRLRSTSR